MRCDLRRLIASGACERFRRLQAPNQSNKWGLFKWLIVRLPRPSLTELNGKEAFALADDDLITRLAAKLFMVRRGQHTWSGVSRWP
jgi:hypothetical protein